MNIIIKRFVVKNECTIGRLSIEQEPCCYTIERPWANNMPFVSCIPEGIYKMVRYDSPSFGPNSWLVDQVLDRTHILFHVANVADDVSGCVGLGFSVYENLQGVKESRVAVKHFYRKTRGESEATLTIENGPCEI